MVDRDYSNRVCSLQGIAVDGLKGTLARRQEGMAGMWIRSSERLNPLSLVAIGVITPFECVHPMNCIITFDRVRLCQERQRR
jgi:hypothetical protein